MKADPNLRIGILGASRAAPLAIVQPARSVDQVKCHAIASRDVGRARRFASAHDIPNVHDTYGELLNDPEIDIVYVSLPNSIHAKWTIRALEQGKHVLCEKPFAANAREAEEMARAARDCGRVLCEAMHPRYHPLAKRLKALITSSEFGALKQIKAHFCVPLLFRDPVRFDYRLAGGATMDVGCYAVSYVRYLAGGEPQARAANAKLSSANVDRFMRAELLFPDGVEATITCSIRSAFLLRLDLVLVCEAGTIRVWNPYLPHKARHHIHVKAPAGNRKEVVVGESSYVCQLRALISAILERTPLEMAANDSVANMRVIDAIYLKAGLTPRGMPTHST